MQVKKLGATPPRVIKRRHYEDQIKEELEWGMTRTEYDEVKDAYIRYGTRLDNSRILMTDEDNQRPNI